MQSHCPDRQRRVSTRSPFSDKYRKLEERRAPDLLVSLGAEQLSSGSQSVVRGQQHRLGTRWKSGFAGVPSQVH